MQKPLSEAMASASERIAKAIDAIEQNRPLHELKPILYAALDALNNEVFPGQEVYPESDIQASQTEAA